MQSRTKLDTNCPYFSNYKVLKGFNDLATIYPEIAKEWHTTKNGGLKPDEFGAGTDKKVWWKCDKGHEWEATIVTRTHYEASCPVCANRKLLVGYNDLATTYPEIAKEWHPNKNRNLKPTDLMAGANKKVWWKCEAGHEWEALVASRTMQHQNCPYCSNQKY